MSDPKKPDAATPPFPAMLTNRELYDRQGITPTNIVWVTPPSRYVAPSRDERIRRAVEKYKTTNPRVVIDGHEYAVIDVTLSPAVSRDPISTRLTTALVEDYMTTKLEADLRENNARLYLELEALKGGTVDQRERHARGYLPEDELTQLARHELFQPLAALDLRRWASRDREGVARDLKHAVNCDFVGHEVEFETCDVDSLTADEFKRLKVIDEGAAKISAHPWTDGLLGGAVFTTTTAHWATCKLCGAEAVRHSTKVTVNWAGRQLVREFALTDRPTRKVVL